MGTGRTTLALAVALACVPSAVSSAAPSAEALAPRRLVLSQEAVHAHTLRVRRAAAEHRLQNPRGVVEALESIDFAAGPRFEEADRGAFLLGQAYLALGSHDRFVTLARSVSRWELRSAYTRWLNYQLLLFETDRFSPAQPPADSATTSPGSTAAAADSIATAAGGGFAASQTLTAGLLLRRGDAEGALEILAKSGPRETRSPLALYLEARALAAIHGDEEPALAELSIADTTTPLGRDLAGAALVRRATRALERGEDAVPLLESVPPASRFASRARHMLGVIALERGESERGRLLLESLLAADSTYPGRREVRLALAGQALEEGRWGDAHGTYQQTDLDWSGHRDALRAMQTDSSFEELWSSWQHSSLSDAWVLDPDPSAAAAAEIAAMATDLESDPSPAASPPLASAAPGGTATRWPVAPPPAEAWREILLSADRLGERAEELARVRRAMDLERATLSGRRGYLAIGRDRARSDQSLLETRAAWLDSLRGTLDSLDRRLRSLRDETIQRLAFRTRVILEECEKNQLWMRGMRRLHLEGPDRERATPAPDGYPGADSLMLEEERLAAAVRSMAAIMAAEGPERIAQSYLLAWRPRLIDRTTAQDEDAHRLVSWARGLGASIDSGIAAAATSDTLLAMERRAQSLAGATDSLRFAHQALRDRVAREAVGRALGELEGEREAIDYGLAAAAYARAVRLGARADSAATDSLQAGLEGGGELDDPESTRLRGEAIAALRGFLDRHPESHARGEMRFRLADLLLVEAQHDFRERMAAYVRGQAAASAGTLPVLSHAGAFELYEKILAEDPGFERRDAVLFNAGMILADQGDPGAARYFQNLVAQHPKSPYGQEALLRMGDMSFNEKHYAESIPLYQRAAQGPDASLQAIALYKIGWAHFNQDGFTEAAEAFGAVLDLYATGRRIEIRADVESEAEAYLVHCMARAGGANAFAAYFGRAGGRPYEKRVLLALGQHFRRFSLFDEAIAVDAMFVERYPLDPDALVSAARRAETYQRSERSDLARGAQLDYSARFAPGGAWHQAQTSDSIRTAGSEFARSSWKSVALHHHLEARKGKSPDDWRKALELYEKVLSIWPNDPDAPNLALNAGEASAQLGEYPQALEHYAAAARSGPDSTASRALWQRVAVTDAWYEKTRSDSGTRTAVGRDSLARAVLGASDEMLSRFPDHPQAADLVWRQGNLAFAHGWLDRAASDFGRLATAHPRDARAPQAATLRGDALFRTEKFEEAGAAYERALEAARTAGIDTLQRRVAKAIPVSYYRHAESVVAAEPGSFGRHAALFEQVATRWPQYEHGHQAQYRAGLAYLQAGSRPEGVRAMQSLIRDFPRSEYVRDAHLQIAKAWEAGGSSEQAAEAYLGFAQTYPADSSAADAWLKAADLYDTGGKKDRAEELRLAYIRAYPNDLESAMEILEPLARRDLATVGTGRPISALLPPPPATRKAAAKSRKGSPAGSTSPATSASSKAAPPPSHLADYLRRAEASPALASRGLLAQVQFLKAEESYSKYGAATLRQPLAKSIATKQGLLDTTLAEYRRSLDQGAAEWAHASAYRIGEALVAFGDALERSERPADLQGDALRAYEEVLRDKSQTFYDRGEEVWADLLRQKSRQAPEDPWIQKTQSSLWRRLGTRFFYRPEADFPIVTAKPPERPRAAKERPEKTRERAGDAARADRELAQRKGDEP